MMTDSALATVITSQMRDGIGIVSFARPARLNAMGPTTTPQLRAAVEDLGNRSDVRVVTLCGESRASCTGLDMETGIAPAAISDPAEEMALAMRASADLIWTMRSTTLNGWPASRRTASRPASNSSTRVRPRVCANTLTVRPVRRSSGRPPSTPSRRWLSP
jgi:hypothetical protein